jgi:hypothetical protein
MLITIAMLLLCDEPECSEISACLGRLLAVALTFSLLSHGGVHFLWSAPYSSMNMSSVHRMRHALG